MTTRDDLDTIGNYRRNLPTTQGETVARARAEGITWREIAELLGMTEQGLLKAQRVYQERSTGQ